jgi:hypothetical protein
MMVNGKLTVEVIDIFFNDYYEQKIEKSKEYRYRAFMANIDNEIARDIDRYENNFKDWELSSWGNGDILKAWLKCGLDAVSEREKMDYTMMSVKRDYNNVVMGLIFPFSESFDSSFDKQCVSWFTELKDFILSYPDSITFDSNDYKCYRNECLSVLNRLSDIRTELDL